MTSPLMISSGLNIAGIYFLINLLVEMDNLLQKAFTSGTILLWTDTSHIQTTAVKEKAKLTQANSLFNRSFIFCFLFFLQATQKFARHHDEQVNIRANRNGACRCQVDPKDQMRSLQPVRKFAHQISAFELLFCKKKKKKL